MTKQEAIMNNPTAGHMAASAAYLVHLHNKQKLLKMEYDDTDMCRGQDTQRYKVLYQWF